MSRRPKRKPHKDAISPKPDSQPINETQSVTADVKNEPDPPQTQTIAGTSGPIVLPDQQRQSIIAEEEFRKAIATRIESGLATRKEKILSVLNAPVTIWLLSGVFLGFLGFGYTKVSEVAQRQARDDARVDLIMNEILFRSLESGIWDAEGIEKNLKDKEWLFYCCSVLESKPLFVKIEKLPGCTRPEFERVSIVALYQEIYSIANRESTWRSPNPSVIAYATSMFTLRRTAQLLMTNPSIKIDQELVSTLSEHCKKVGDLGGILGEKGSLTRHRWAKFVP
jgi:hypothetical protein